MFKKFIIFITIILLIYAFICHRFNDQYIISRKAEIIKNRNYPYKLGGEFYKDSEIEQGIDCSGFVSRIFIELITNDIRSNICNDNGVKQIYNYCQINNFLHSGPPAIGDIIFIDRINKSKTNKFAHIGICLNKSRQIISVIHHDSNSVFKGTQILDYTNNYRKWIGKMQKRNYDWYIRKYAHIPIN